MSLNGLDDAKVIEAYQGALAEGGGWFLLKYVSRDAVECDNNPAKDRLSRPHALEETAALPAAPR